MLDRLDDELVNSVPDGWGTNSVAGLIVHCCELAPSWFEMPGHDRTDGALVLHVLEELFQHLGHMEVTAEALVPQD